MELQPAADVLQDFLTECELKLGQFAPQNISNMLWACATLGVSPGAKLWKPAVSYHHISTARHSATTLLLDAKHALQAVLQTPSSNPRSSQQTCDAGTADATVVCVQHNSLQRRISECRKKVLGSGDISVSPAAAPLHASGYQGHPVGHGHHWLHSCQAFPARRGRPVPLPHVPIQSTEHRQCHLGLCQVWF